MLDRVFPAGLNNNYHGQSLAIYLLYFILTTEVVLGLFTLDFQLLETITVPKDALISILLLIITLRFRSMIPVVYLLMLVVDSIGAYSAMLYNQTSDAVSTSSTPLVLYGITVIGFILSITGDRCYYRNNAVLKRP